ncbi:MAG: ABC transporter ATP-binding protein [Clostridium sp.]|uniref:ABC transporter ATP-binding protein n=1 Tax=Clostridium sp. TaxID=1506 RepID=UPI003F3FB7E7
MRILEVKDLRKVYGDKVAVDGVSFCLEEGEILGFLGPNGAGKSTTINILSTILKSDGGEIKFRGKPILKSIRDYKKHLGVVPQSLALFENLSAYENVKYFASFYGLRGNVLKERVLEALEMVGLKEKKDETPKTFSGGMKRRLNIACALAHKPEILILDEPTVGIDPQSRNHILESIKRLREEGTSVIYTTHYMEEVESICDRVVIVDLGKVIEEGKISEVINRCDKENKNLEEVFLCLTGKNLRD